MRTVVVLPDELINPPELQRCLRLCLARFDKYGQVFVEARPGNIANYRRMLPLATINQHDHTKPIIADIVVLVHELPITTTAIIGPNTRTYTYRAHPYNCRSGSGPFDLINPGKLDKFEFPQIDEHIFTRLSSHKKGFVNFPFGVLYIDAESGPIDAFGFRINFDHRTLIGRPKNHRVVTIFGGSAAFSCAVSYEEMFSTRLEEFLNAREQEKGSDIKWTVLNFGMHDNVVMQEMLTYLMFVDRLKPEVVIGHDGHNDIWYGLSCDPYLVAGQQMIYQRHSEQWSRLIHGTEHVPIPDINSCSVDEQQYNSPHNIVRAYGTRKRQWQSLVERQGGKFFWGLQPLILSKPRRCGFELEIAEAVKNHPFGIGEPLFHAYTKLHQELLRAKLPRFVDFHTYFQTFDESFHLMSDHVHCTFLGDELIARKYAEAIAQEFGE